MKYLLILSWMGLGGAERQAINLAEHIQNKGGDVTILGIDGPGRANEICEEKNIKCISFPPKNTFYSIKYKILNKLGIKPLTNEEVALLGLIRDLGKYIEDNEYDICISYCTTANIVLGIVKKEHPHITAIWYQGDAGIYDRTEGLQIEAVRAIDGIISNGITAYEWIKKAYDRETPIIYNGVLETTPQKDRTKWRQNLNASDSDIVCTMVANLTSAKDHMFLLKVWNELLKTDQRFILAFAGLFGSEYENLKEYAESNGLTDNVRFLGHVVDVFGLLHASDICVFGAKSEGSPNGVIEGCLSRLPVMATDLPEIREAVAEENYPYLYAKGDVTDAVDKLLLLADDIALRNSLGEANRSKDCKQFDAYDNLDAIMIYSEDLRKKQLGI